MNKTIIAHILLLLVSGNALADDAGILRCRGINEAPARLACYDALVIPAAEPRVLAGKPAVQPGTRASQAASSPAPNAPGAPAAQRADLFGLENRSAPGTVDAIESYIAGRFEGWDAKSSIKLANGQVWQIADDSSRSLTIVDPKVRIRRGALGSFYLEFEKINHSPRVRRVQ